MPTLLRETQTFKAEKSARGVKLTVKIKGCVPKSRVVDEEVDWDRYLKGLGAREFDNACVVDYGVGVLAK